MTARLLKSIILVVIIWMISVSNAFSQILNIGWEPWEPYAQKLDDGTYTGVDLEVIIRAAELAGLNVEFTEMPWGRLLKEIEAGNMDVTTAATKTAEREHWAHFSEPYRTESFVIFVRKGESDKFQLSGLADITNTSMQLGVTYGYYYGEDYKALMQDSRFKSQLQPVRKDELHFEKLVRGRIDGFLMDPIAAKLQLSQKGFGDDMEIHPVGSVYSSDIHYMMSKESVSQSIYDKLNNGLDLLKSSGEHEKIILKYTSLD